VNKILPPFVMPLLVGMVLAVAGIVTRKRWLGVLGVGLVWLAATPIVAESMLWSIEGGQVRTMAQKASEADLIVVLSNGRHLAPGPDRVSEWSDPDRFFAGVDLWHAGKAGRIVFTDATLDPDEPDHAEVMRQTAERMGVDPAAILVVGPVATTEDEADALACTIVDGEVAPSTFAEGTPRILLVTSAFHVPRAVRVFERRGFVVQPFPVDFQRSEAEPFTPLRLVPSSAALRTTEMSFRELIGRLWEAWFGRIAAPACIVRL